MTMPFSNRPSPHVGIVEDACRHPGVGLAGVATAGAAIEARGVRVVGGGAAMAGEHDEPREVLGQRHAAQHRLGLGQRLFGGEAGQPAADGARFQPRADAADDVGVKPVGVGVVDGAGQAGAVADQLGRKEQPHGFDEGEGRDGGQLERLPGLGGAAAQQAKTQDLGFLLRGRAGDGFADGEGRRQQHRALRAAAFPADRHIFDRVAEEAGKADRLGLGRRRLSSARR